MFGNWEKEESKADHDYFCNTTKISKKVKDIVDLSSELVLLVLQVDCRFVEEYSTVKISYFWANHMFTHIKKFSVLSQLADVEEFVFGVYHVSSNIEVVVDNILLIEQICNK